MSQRYVIELPPRLDSILNELAFAQDIKKSEVIRRSIVLYDYMKRQDSLRKDIFIKREDGKLTELCLL